MRRRLALVVGAGCAITAVLALPASVAPASGDAPPPPSGPAFGASTDRVALAATPDGHGYWIADANGRVAAFGDAAALGGLADGRLSQPVVTLAPTPDGGGYWLATADGRVAAFGDAPALGGLEAMRLNRPVVQLAPTADGHGYWLIAGDGGVFSFGDAAFHGSTGSMVLNQPVVAMASTPSGSGYWLVAADGGIFNFGDARFFGSTGNLTLNRPVVGMLASTTGSGYRLVAADGGIFAFGDRRFAGSLGGAPPVTPIATATPTPDGAGYWLLGADGAVWTFGGAEDHGSDISPAVSVGVRTEVITDPQRPTPARGPIPGHPGRTLPTTIFYPAAALATEGEAPGAPVAGGGPFPLIVFAHGFDVTPATYRLLLHQWAAAGYVVAAPEFAISGADGPGPPGRGDLSGQPGDVSVVISALLGDSATPSSWLSGQVDAAAVGVAGHSDGGSTIAALTLNSAIPDPRVRAAIVGSGSELALAGGGYGTVANVPVLFVQGDQDPYNSAADTTQLYQLAHDPKGYLDVLGGGHLPPYVDPTPQAQAVRAATTGFFDRTLKGQIDGLERLQRDGNLAGLTRLWGSLT